MKLIRCTAVVLPLFFVLWGCERRESAPISAPQPAQRPEILEARWVMEKGALDAEVRAAAASPLVQRALNDSRNPRLTPYYSLAVKAIGSVSDGSKVGATILPHIVDGDQTHAAFVSLLNRDGYQVADYAELILGRDPTSLELGFEPIQLGDRIAWIKGGPSYFVGADGLPSRSPEKRKWTKFIECVLEEAPIGCAVGASLADEIAPGVPRARAIGCGIGAAAATVGCALDHLF